MKLNADQTSRAKEHNFKVGDVVYIASMENGKLDSTFRDTPCTTENQQFL